MSETPAPTTFVVSVEDADHGSPTRFSLGKRTIEVVEVLERWPGSDHLYLKLRAGDGSIYILRQDTIEGSWQLVLFRNEQFDEAAPTPGAEPPRYRT